MNLMNLKGAMNGQEMNTFLMEVLVMVDVL